MECKADADCTSQGCGRCDNGTCAYGCDAGQVCCLNQNGPSINCLSPVMCPGNGQSGTWLACAAATDCLSEPQNLCQPVPGTGDAGTLKYCAPASPRP